MEHASTSHSKSQLQDWAKILKKSGRIPSRGVRISAANKAQLTSIIHQYREPTNAEQEAEQKALQQQIKAKLSKEAKEAKAQATIHKFIKQKNITEYLRVEDIPKQSAKSVRVKSYPGLMRLVRRMYRENKNRRIWLCFESFKVPGRYLGKTQPIVLSGGETKALRNLSAAFERLITLLIENKPGSEIEISREHDSEVDNWVDELVGANIAMIVQDLKGACNSRKLVVENIEGLRVMNYVSRHNDCGIEVLKHTISELEELKNIKIRRAVGLKSNEAISVHKMYEIATRFAPDRTIRVIDTEMREITTQEFEPINHLIENMGVIVILFRNNHYTHVTQTKHKETVQAINNREKVHYKRNTMTFDFETRNDIHDSRTLKNGHVLYKQIPTLLSMATYDQIRGNKKAITKSFRKQTCVEDFLDELMKLNDEKKFYYIKAHNGSGFDFFFIYKAIMDSEKYRNLKMNSPVIKGSKILKIEWNNNVFTDTYNFLGAKLENLCRDFDIEHAKLSDFIINNEKWTSMDICLYKNKSLTVSQYYEWLDNNPDINKAYLQYCEYDCISLIEIWTKFVELMERLVNKCFVKFQNKQAIFSKCAINKKPTLPSFANEIFKTFNAIAIENWGYINEAQALDNYAQYKETVVGGISHCAYPGRHNYALACLDVVSEYPACMLLGEFPKGAACDTIKFREDKLGVYLVENVQMTPANITDMPNRTTTGLDWAATTTNISTMTNIDIQRIRDRGGSVDVISGHYWNDTWQPFKVLEPIKNEKMRQDQLKIPFAKNKSPWAKIYLEQAVRNGIVERPNSALRTCCKLLMNALYGKMLERTVNYEYLEMEDCTFHEDGSMSYISQKTKQEVNIEYGKHSALICNGRITIKAESTSSNKFLVFGLFILSLSRLILHSYMDLIGRNNIIASETDSIYFPRDLISRIPDSVEHENYDPKKPWCLLGKEFGNMEVEEANIKPGALFLEKKCYTFEKTKGGRKYVFKGVPQKNLSLNSYETLFRDGSLFVDDILCFERNLFTRGETSIWIGTNCKKIRARNHYKEYYYNDGGQESGMVGNESGIVSA